ncbi:class I SAM-dependent methyltransferase [Pelomonas sp. CA6]|uniref:class I SAM-dependent methyltransferase n=1 Tax=Pelomonas sp. CA6 TaxID=2907999 RepID=UPI001F4C0FBF|nr:class I SAM-dependent methyltransferase [Pelomonas sp. CA6]MCH7344262.1 class I SAM-dependent methyltransferase [Pelomonas sp. CA6]
MTTTLAANDYAAQYREQMRQQRLQPRPAQDWDQRAPGYGANRRQSQYAVDFIARMDLRGARTLLDVGSGPGTLALPLATRLRRVFALDHSAGMLEQLRLQAARTRQDSIETLHLAWEDDWRNVPLCDIAIASRSTLVEDLDAALAKLLHHARLRIYLTYLVGGHFMDPGVLALLGRDTPRAPEHTLLLGMLEQRGLRPRVDILETPSRLAGCADAHELAQRIEWSHGPVDEAARSRLARWFEADAERARRGGAPMRWAFVACDVPAKGPGLASR